MSRPVLLASFLVMVVLSLIAGGLVAFPPAPPPAPSPLLENFDPARITSLRIERGGRTTQSLTRDPAAGWTLAWGDPRTSWPVAEIRVRSALRLLAEATFTPTLDAVLGDDPVVLHIDAQTPHAIALGGSSVAGRAPVALGATDPRPGLTDDRLHALFARTGMLPWRDTRAMPAAARDASAIVLQGGSDSGRRVELMRLQGQWTMAAPVRDRADPEAAQALVDALARLTIVAFRDDVQPPAAGLEPPAGLLRLSGGRGESAYTWTIEIGGSARADRSETFVRLSGDLGGKPAFGPVIATLPDEALLSIFTRSFAAPENNLARTALATPAADIRRFSIRTPDGARTWRYERTIDGWRITSPGADQPRPATTAEAAAIPAVLQLLSATPAPVVRLAAPDALTPVATLDIEGAAGLAAESITIGRCPAPAGTPGAPTAILAIGSGPSWRTYGPMPAELAALLPIAP